MSQAAQTITTPLVNRKRPSKFHKESGQYTGNLLVYRQMQVSFEELERAKRNVLYSAVADSIEHGGHSAPLHEQDAANHDSISQHVAAAQVQDRSHWFPGAPKARYLAAGALVASSLVGALWVYTQRDTSVPTDPSGSSEAAAVESEGSAVPGAEGTVVDAAPVTAPAAAPPVSSDSAEIEKTQELLANAEAQVAAYEAQIDKLSDENVALQVELDELSAESLNLNRELLELELSVAQAQLASDENVEQKVVYNFVNVPIGESVSTTASESADFVPPEAIDTEYASPAGGDPRDSVIEEDTTQFVDQYTNEVEMILGSETGLYPNPHFSNEVNTNQTETAGDPLIDAQTPSNIPRPNVQFPPIPTEQQ